MYNADRRLKKLNLNGTVVGVINYIKCMALNETFGLFFLEKKYIFIHTD